MAADGQAAIGPCDAPPTPLGHFAHLYFLDLWEHWLRRFASFQAETLFGRVIFRGQGQEVASPAWQRALAAWARLVQQELQLEQIAGGTPHHLIDLPDARAVLDGRRTDDVVLMLRGQGLQRVVLADGSTDLLLRFDGPARFGALMADGAQAIYQAAVLVQDLPIYVP